MPKGWRESERKMPALQDKPLLETSSIVGMEKSTILTCADEVLMFGVLSSGDSRRTRYRTRSKSAHENTRIVFLIRLWTRTIPRLYSLGYADPQVQNKYHRFQLGAVPSLTSRIRFVSSFTSRAAHMKQPKDDCPFYVHQLAVSSPSTLHD